MIGHLEAEFDPRNGDVAYQNATDFWSSPGYQRAIIGWYLS
jgi:hypothetical protein